MAKKRPARKKTPPRAEIEVLGAIDIYSNAEPLFAEDEAKLRAVTTRAQLEELLQGHRHHYSDQTPDRVVDFRDLETGKVQRATVYFQSFYHVEDIPEHEANRFGEV